MMDRWVSEYPKIADRHRDSAGRPWQHTWFYPGEQPIDRNMTALQKLVAGGYGETELHLHHFNDTPQSARERFERAIAWFQTFGFLKSADGATHFGFIHGNWSLDNSRGNAFCGNNRELAMLRELGCFADYTFSSIFEVSQPSSVNNIFEATDDDGPKSYDRGVPWQAGVRPAGDLAIFQGPLLLVPTARPAKLFLEVENAEIHAAVPVTPRRVDAWMRANIHVGGRPEWRFIKIHTHGATYQGGRGRDTGSGTGWGAELHGKDLQRRSALCTALCDGARGVQCGAGGGGREAGGSAAVFRLLDSALCGESEIGSSELRSDGQARRPIPPWGRRWLRS